MPQLIVRRGAEERRFSFRVGPSIRDILEEVGFQVRTACRGHGACGLCEVRVLTGEPSAPTGNERLHILPERLDQGVRLACQTRPRGDLRLEILQPALPTKWQSLPCVGFPASAWPGNGPLTALLQEVKAPLGVAVDLGTTNIRLAILELRDGRCLAQRRGGNPQVSYGADVLTRLVAAQESSESARVLGELAAVAIGEGLGDLARREGIDLRRVVSLAVVGNTPMLALLAEKNHHRLLQPQHWQSPVDCRPENAARWVEAWSIYPRAEVKFIQPLAGFVGSDLLSGLVAVRLMAGPAPALFIDLGTNSEIALWDGKELWVTSAAGGPAFELWGLSHGMPAEPGAVYQVNRGADGFLHYQVIGGEKPKGFCGSGLVDLIARLLETGRLSPTGRFSGGPGEAWRADLPGTASLGLSLEDVDSLQRAKAAIGTGVMVLAGRSGVKLGQLQRVCLAGEFGRFLDAASAQAIGLLPAVPVERVELSTDATLRGCGDLILSPAAMEHLSELRAAARVVNLAITPDFEEIFLDNLYLKPLKED